MRASTIAPAHMEHGSFVTYSTVFSSRQFSSADAACVIAIISACAVGSFSSSVWLWAEAIRRGGSCLSALPIDMITQPVGTSPASAAFCAWRSAISI